MAQRHQLLLFPICIILVRKADRAMGYLFYTVNGYDCFVRMPIRLFGGPGQILEYLGIV